MNVELVVNPAAANGRAGARADELQDALHRAGDQPELRLHRPPSAAATVELLAGLVANGAERVVVAGGDGLVHLAVGALAGSDTVLGLLPVGSGNDFARAFGLDGAALDACAAAALGPARRVDLLSSVAGMVASVATFGFSARVNERGNRLRLGPFNRFRYQLATLAELPRLRPSTVTIRLDGGPAEKLAVTLAAVANTAYFGGGMAICPAADPSDGLAELTVVGPVGRLELLRFFPRVFSGTHLEHRAVRTLRAQRIDIESAPTEVLQLWADGEPLGPAPLSLQVAPGALLLAAP